MFWNWRKIVKWSVLTPLILVSAVYAFNALIILAVAPGNAVHASRNQTIGDVRIEYYHDLKSGGVLGFSMDANGYVNMLSEENIIYVSADKYDKNLPVGGYLYRHEYTHVLQKSMVAHKSGGYPSIENPLQSMKYYYYLHKLNSDLREVMPEINRDNPRVFAWFMTDGFEAAADCYAQPPSSPEEQVFYEGSYLKNGYCNAEQKRLAVSLITTDEWFNPLTKEEKEKLVPVNIVNTKNKIY